MTTREEGNTTPSWAEVIRLAMEAALLEVNTGTPAKVVSYDPATTSATVQPLLRRAYRDQDENLSIVKQPEILTVPVQFPGGGGWAIRWRLIPGDLVWLKFGQRSLEKWKQAPPGDLVDPVESRHHHLSDAVAEAILRPPTGALPDPGEDLVIGREDGSNEIRIKQDGTIELGQGAPTQGVVRLGDETLVDGSTDNAFIAWMAQLTTAFNTHTHVSAAPGSPTPPPVPLGPTSAPSTVTGKTNSASEEVNCK